MLHRAKQPGAAADQLCVANVVPGGKDDEMYASAFEFGWQSCLQYGSAAARHPVTFESSELERQWNHRQATVSSPLPWEAASEATLDAWNQVFDAIADGSEPKASAR